MRMAVLQSEDGGFFYHQGFLPDAIREAMVYDLKERRFARGGSTISMQLVKNVFLNRRKNIARKLEEALIVWLIEQNRLTSKERMFEVYLNIAEWGYGSVWAVRGIRVLFWQASVATDAGRMYLLGFHYSEAEALSQFIRS